MKTLSLSMKKAPADIVRLEAFAILQNQAKEGLWLKPKWA
jgi:hypothetical protein